METVKSDGTARGGTGVSDASPRREQGLGPLPVVLVVDVEALEALGEVRRDDAALARTVRGHGARPGDLERAVLDVDLRERLVLPRVPGHVEVRLVEQRLHRAAVEHPHLPRVLLDPLDGADRVRLGRRQQLLQPAPERLGPRNGFVARTSANRS